ncbi:Ig-like domain-containing protein [uncultured Methanobrevibacter sp.]|uniref:Ig-like domain-containing protein n=1 Tax=uncultured Methanobrevibacter sp. TaxID=253161 RepID=UPI0025EE49BD|nr:Ig-like domain-containing protein [uncultured Methanobrevibacter sp.]
MIILDWIKELLNNNKRTATIYAKQLVKKYGGSEKFEVGLFDGDKPLTGKTVTINVNGRDYDKVTDDSGIARLNINLGPGVYTPLISFKDDDYNLVTAFSKVIVQTDTRMEGTDINMTYHDGTVYQCAVYDNFGRVAGDVDIKVNGKTYHRTPDIEGLYKLNINLKPGTYDIAAEFLGDDYHLPSKVTNTIVINPKPQPKPEPVELHSYITEQGPGKLGQKTPYSCGPHSLMQCIYRLTGIELSESTLMSVCGTTTYGTDHDGLATGLAWFNRKYGYNLKMLWKNKSELSWDEIQSYIDNGALLFHLLYRRSDGHYEVAQDCDSPMNILNSLGDRCGSGYYGYIESRSRAEQQSYINGISQKSVCIITP